MNTKLTNSLLSTLSPHTSKTFVSRSSIWFLMVIGIFFTACEKDSIHIESDRQNYLAIKYPNTPENPHWKYITGKTNSNLISTEEQ